MTDRAVTCLNRDQNFGRVCVPSMPNDPHLWCRDCLDRRCPPPTCIESPLTRDKLVEIRVHYEKYSRVKYADGRLLLGEVLRLRR